MGNSDLKKRKYSIPKQGQIIRKTFYAASDPCSTNMIRQIEELNFFITVKILIPEWKEKYTAGRMNDFDERNSIHFWGKYSFFEELVLSRQEQ